MNGPPDPGEKNGSRIRNIRPPKVHFRKHNRGDNATVVLEKRDAWLECYLAFLDGEIVRLKGGVIARHCRDCAAAHYSRFQSSRAPHDRFKTWTAVRTCCGWLAQLRGGLQ
jgi:hypothetical protein